MNPFAGALRRVPGTPAPSQADHLWAAAAMAVVPSVIGFLIATATGACHAGRAANFYEWGCLLPMTVVMTSLGFLVLVPIAVVLARKGRRVGPDGWLVAIVGGGLLAQVVIVSYFRFVVVGNGFNPLTQAEMLFMPWPFLAGAISAGVYRAALAWRLELRR